MPLPATMYVDYIRVYEWNGQGEVHFGPPTAQSGSFGLLTDLTPTNGNLTIGTDANVWVWESTLIYGTIPPYEGANGLTWKTNAKGWFGAGVMTDQPLNLFSFIDGDLKFRIKIPGYVTFKIGVIDTWGNQYYVQFPANQTKYGLVRNGNWGQVTIPVADLRGLAIDMRMLSYSFVILEESGQACEFAIDDIYYTGGFVAGVDGPAMLPRTATLLDNAPNPFNANTELRFELAGDESYAIVVYDAAGQRVREFQGLGRAGLNAVRWDGRDGQGRGVSSGVYYYRLETGAGADTGKMVLVK